MKDQYTKQWIIDNSIEICSQYENGVLTLRSLHYQLVGLGMTNDIQHYKRVVKAMIDARWDESIQFEQFSDLDREMSGSTEYSPVILDDEIEHGKDQIRAWMNHYSRNRWENQDYYIEVFIEKKALQGVFTKPCRNWEVALGACKGYPSLTFLYETSLRFKAAESEGKQLVIIYFGDYDPSGEDIPRSIDENLKRFGVMVHIDRIALMEEQVIEWKLPHAPAKETDSRTANWTGLGQVELDAVKPEKLQSMCNEAIQKYFDEEKYGALIEEEETEREEYRRELKIYVQSI